MKKLKNFKILPVLAALVFCVNAVSVSLPRPAFNDKNTWAIKAGAPNANWMITQNTVSANGCFVAYQDRGALNGKNFTFEADVLALPESNPEFGFGVVFNLNSGFAKGLDFLGQYGSKRIIGYTFWDYRSQKPVVPAITGKLTGGSNAWIKTKIVHQNGIFHVYVNGRKAVSHRDQQAGSVGFYVLNCSMSVRNVKIQAN